MDALREYDITFTALKDGTHTFLFDLGKPFFDLVHEETYEGGLMHATVTLDKRGHLLVTDIHLEGDVDTRCHLCDGALRLPLRGDQRQIFQLDSTEDYDDEELVAVSPSATSVNLTHYFYECLRLSTPARIVHPEGRCDPEVVSVLARHHTDGDHADPRWAALEQLKKNTPPA